MRGVSLRLSPIFLSHPSSKPANSKVEEVKGSVRAVVEGERYLYTSTAGSLNVVNYERKAFVTAAQSSHSNFLGWEGREGVAARDPTSLLLDRAI